MEMPIHYSLSDFQSNYKIDFIEASADNNISFLEYFEQLESKYQNELREFEDSKIKLTELNQKLHQRTMDKLDAMYGMGKFKEQLKRQADDINEIDQFNERFKLPRRLSYTNRYKLGDEIWNCILEFEKIIKFIRFEIANIETSKETTDYGKNELKPKEKLIVLDKLGVIKFLTDKLDVSDNATHLAEILGAITGIDNQKGTLTGYCNYLIRPDHGNKNSPYFSETTVRKANQIYNTFNIKDKTD